MWHCGFAAPRAITNRQKLARKRFSAAQAGQSRCSDLARTIDNEHVGDGGRDLRARDLEETRTLLRHAARARERHDARHDAAQALLALRGLVVRGLLRARARLVVGGGAAAARSGGERGVVAQDGPHGARLSVRHDRLGRRLRLRLDHVEPSLGRLRERRAA